jgi:hypothetical protein
MFPSAISSSGKRALPMPRLSTGAPASAGAPPQHKMNILPSAIDALRAKPALDVIEHVKPSTVMPDVKDVKKGRVTKAEKLKEAKAKISETLRDLLMKDPSKKDIREFFVSRVKELS